MSGASYIGIGAIFKTKTKNDAKYVSLELLKEIAFKVKIPTCAIGGIDKNSILQLKDIRIDGIALVSAVLNQNNIKESAKELKELFRQIKRIRMRKVLTIAGSDCSGGAGVQADIKTITAHKMYAMSVITALTAQNTTGVFDVLNINSDFIMAQMDAIFSDIRPDSVKIGMISTSEIILTIAKSLKKYEAKNIVLDPVMISTSGSKLLDDNAINCLIEELFPLATLITLNVPEAEVLTSLEIKDQKDMIKAAAEISKFYKGGILIKGGHLVSDATYYFYKDGKGEWFVSQRVQNSNTHGTGCTLSSAIACHLANGAKIEPAIFMAKEYLVGALNAQLNLGSGNGPLDHMWYLNEICN